MLKSPCIGCPHEHEDKRRNPTCVECEDRIEYADAVTGPLAKPVERRELKDPGVVREREANSAKPLPPAENEDIECSLCGHRYPKEAYRTKNGKGRFKTCPECREKKKTEKREEIARKNGNGIPPGFIHIPNDYRKHQEFITISGKTVHLSAEIIRKLELRDRVDAFFNPKTRQIGIRVNNSEGDRKLNIRRGSGSFSFKSIIGEYKIRSARRLPVAYSDNGEFVMTREGLK